jgi:hypothetical protein
MNRQTRTGRSPRIQDLVAAMFYTPGEHVPGPRVVSQSDPEQRPTDRFVFGRDDNGTHLRLTMQQGRYRPTLVARRARSDFRNSFVNSNSPYVNLGDASTYSETFRRTGSATAAFDAMIRQLFDGPAR